MEVVLTEAESSALQQALATYLADLRMEIADTDSRRFRDGLKGERATLESIMAKLEAARGSSEMRDDQGREVIRLVATWWTEST